MDPGNDDQKERSPDDWQVDEASGIEALPNKVERYAKAKERALEVAEYIEGLRQAGTVDRQLLRPIAHRLATCGDVLVFHHYLEVNQVRLKGGFLCSKHLLCPLCAIRRGSKALQAYLPRYEVVIASQPRLRPFLVTLTVKDGPDLKERFQHLQKSQHELWKRKQRKRGSALDQVEAAVWSYEVKRGRNSGLWHPHLHMVAMAEDLPLEDAREGTLGRLSREWHDITGDSFMVNVRPISQADPVSGFLEVFKYALKFSDMSAEDTFRAFCVLAGRRLVGSAGAFRGVEIPESLHDEELDGPYVELLYRYFAGGYSLESARKTAAAVERLQPSFYRRAPRQVPA